MTDSLPGPCYPNYPDLMSAFAVHRRSDDGATCRRCGLLWDDPEPEPGADR